LYDVRDKTVVVIDILRATSCMTTAFAHGINSITPFAKLEDCIAMKAKGYFTAGERDGKKVEGCDLGNSPFEYMDEKLKGQKIAFTSRPVTEPNLSPNAEIYVINADGTGLERRTFNGEEERGPAWSPDGTKMAFMCRKANFEICVMNADGTNQAQLTDNSVPDLTPTWSPDGNYLVFHRPVSPVCGPGLRQLFLMNADGTGQTQLTSAPEDPCGNAFASWDLVRVHVQAPAVTQPSVRAPAAPPVPKR